MTGFTIGSLFSGYGGLDRAAEQVFGARTVWVSDIDKGACKVLAYRYPHAPNLGDITRVDWATVLRVGIITGGSPCQDLSTAGRRAGMKEGTRSGLWESMREAIATLKPTYVLWENVHGALSAEATSDLEHCPGCMGGSEHGGPVLRALGRVLGDLADLGYDTEWCGLRAADVGACHGRFRVFVLAWRRDLAYPYGQRVRVQTLGRLTAVESPSSPGCEWRSELAMLPTPRAQARDVPYARDDYHHNLEEWAGHYEAGTLHTLPTPRDTDGTKGGPNQRGSSGDLMLPSAVIQLTREESCSSGSGGAFAASFLTSTSGLSGGPAAVTAAGSSASRWGQYAAAIARHEQAWGVPAPEPTEPGPKGNPRLSARFAEWMMMQPPGWITDTPGVTRNEALKLCGNGVVTPQAVHALRVMLNRIGAA